MEYWSTDVPGFEYLDSTGLGISLDLVWVAALQAATAFSVAVAKLLSDF